LLKLGKTRGKREKWSREKASRPKKRKKVGEREGGNANGVLALVRCGRQRFRPNVEFTVKRMGKPEVMW